MPVAEAEAAEAAEAEAAEAAEAAESALSTGSQRDGSVRLRADDASAC